jgi:hypothetical protein
LIAASFSLYDLGCALAENVLNCALGHTHGWRGSGMPWAKGCHGQKDAPGANLFHQDP